MRMRSILLALLACLALAAVSQPVQHREQWQWYLDEVISDVFVGRNYFEYYYTPSAADVQQRDRGEVTFFLNSPEGLNSKKVRNMIDRLMASYDDIKAVGEWNVTTSTYWKEFRYERNKFRFSVKRKALDDGTYYVSVTETANYYKSLGKDRDKEAEAKADARERPAVDKPAKRGSRQRRPVIVDDDDEEAASALDGQSPSATAVEAAIGTPVVSEKQQRREARERQEARKQEERMAKRRAQEQEQAQKKALKEAEKLKKAEEKKRREEEKRLKKEEEKQRQEQARAEREQARREQQAARQQAVAPKPVESNYHYTDVALWLSEKYDFTQTGAGSSSCTMYSTAVKDVEMAKLAIKNALKGSNARMAVPWRVNDVTSAIETGYTVDGHVLVFAIGNDADGKVTVTISEVSNEQFELFKQQLNSD